MNKIINNGVMVVIFLILSAFLTTGSVFPYEPNTYPIAKPQGLLTSSMFDNSFCNINNSLLYRNETVWGCIDADLIGNGSGGGGTPSSSILWQQGTPKWLWNDSDELFYNETFLNITYQGWTTAQGYLTSYVDTDTRVKGDNYWLYNDTATMYLNETLLNLTIDGRDSDTGVDTRVKADFVYLYNDSTTIYLNETKLNQTTQNWTDAKGFLKSLWKQGTPKWLYNDSDELFYNDTWLNMTVQNWTNTQGFLKTYTDTDTRVKADFVTLWNDSTTMYLNNTGAYNFTTLGNITANHFYGLLNWSNIFNFGNIFDQWLNTTSNVYFTQLNVSNSLKVNSTSVNAYNLSIQENTTDVVMRIGNSKNFTIRIG